MKVKALTLLILICFAAIPAHAAWYDNWKVNGVPLERLFNSTPPEALEMIGGAAVSALVHWLGHVAWLEINDKEWHQDWEREVCDEYLYDSEKREFGRAGFVAQLVGATMLKFSPINDSRFATGYHMYTFSSILLYPAINGNDKDLDLMDRGDGASTTEWIAYTIYSGIMLFTNPPTITKKEDPVLRFTPWARTYWPDYKMQPTGRTNAAGQIEVICLGEMAPEGYQGTPEGQILWLNPELVQEETK